MSNDTVVSLLRVIAEFLDTLTPSEMNALANGRAFLSIEGRKRKKTVRAPRKSLPPKPHELDAAIERLSALDSREAGREFLLNHYSTRTDLELLARRADLPVQKRDNIDALRSRIIESTIGYRLRSQAIQGTRDPHLESEPEYYEDVTSRRRSRRQMDSVSDVP
jgi:hypothetical protein